MLYTIKHLIEITPVKTPYGLPDTPENGFLKENGEFVSYNLLSPHGMDIDKANEYLKQHYEQHMDNDTLKLRLHHRWFSRYDTV